jgi:hypothetical protein
MKYVDYELSSGGFVNRFISTGVFKKEQKFVKSVLKGRVNEWLKYGFAIHENPCRKEFIENRKSNLPEYVDLSKQKSGDKLTIFDQTNEMQMYFPFGNIGVEASGFYYVPTYIRSYYYAIIKTKEDANVEFELSTCGGVTLWANEELVEDFIPFTRNLVKTTTVSINLKAGDNKLLVCLDDLAERDTDYYFRLRRVGTEELKISLPVSDDTDIIKLKNKEEMLDDISFKKESYISEKVNLSIDNLLGEDIKIKAIISPGDFVEKMKNHEDLIMHKEYLLKKNQKTIMLIHSDSLRPAYYYFTLIISEGAIEIKRKIGNQLVRKEFLETFKEKNKNLAERKMKAKETILSMGVDNIYKAAVMFSLKNNIKKAEEIIFSEIAGINEKQDCSDFHFVILLYIYQTYKDILSDKLKITIEETMINYRYWIDEPGDDVMWFFSENHALLFHICQYIAGRNLSDKKFENSGLIGADLEKKAINLLDEWFECFFNEFITEWNSSAYIPVDVLGIGTLYNLTQSGNPLHEKAKKALDMIFYSMCINAHKGTIMTSFGRTYEKEMKGNYNAGTSSILYVAYNAGFLNKAAVGYISLILGDYEAPKEYEQYLNIGDDECLIYQNTQGFENHVNLYLYKNRDVCLSSAIGFSPYKQGYQEHIIQATVDGLAQVFINHPGEGQPYGSGRPNFWAGNGNLPMVMQFENTALVKYDIPQEYRIDYTHAYIPCNEFEHYFGGTNAIAFEKEGGYIGIKSLNEIVMQKMGPCKFREFISKGRKQLWLVRVERRKNYKNVEEFLEELRNIELCYKENGIVSAKEKNKKVYSIDENNNCFLNGEKLYNYPLDVKGLININKE